VVVGAEGIVHRTRDRPHRGLVEDHGRAGRHPLDGGKIADVAADDLQPLAGRRGERQVLRTAGGEVVEDADAGIGVVAKEPLDEM
jgi:hypothetical protein